MSKWGGIARWDAVGAGLCACWLVWAAVCGAAPAVALALLAGTVYLAGRMLTRYRAPVALALAAALAAVVLTGGLRGPEAGYLGYANATGALAVQGVALAGIAATSRSRAPRAVALLLAAVLSASTLQLSHASAVGAALVLVAVAATLAGVRVRVPGGPLVVAGSALVAGIMTVTAAVGLRFGALTDTSDAVWLAALSQRRAQLWHDAVILAAQRPVTGTGAGGFARLAPTAADTDTTMAHSLLLGVAVEAGWVGAVLLAAGMVWALGRTGVHSGAAPQAVAVAAWTAFQLQSAIDYVGSSWAVVAVTAGVAGLATSSAGRSVRRARRPRAGGPRSVAEEARR